MQRRSVRNFVAASAPCATAKHVFHLIVRREERFLIFLQVALITGGQTFQGGEQAEQCGGDAAGFPAQQFPRVRIFLLRHKAAAGGIFVRENQVREFLRSEEDKIFGEARKVRGDASQREKIVERKVAVAHRVQAVGQ